MRVSPRLHGGDLRRTARVYCLYTSTLVVQCGDVTLASYNSPKNSLSLRQSYLIM
jgi:hypothetical protein